MACLKTLADLARNNAWSNLRLLGACAGLSPEEFTAPRTGFFPSLCHTLNHILTVDWYYLDALTGGAQGLAVFDPEIPFPELAPLRQAQYAADRRLIALCDGLDEARAAELVTLDRGGAEALRERRRDILMHLFVHQIHHRGQAHAMLSGTAVRPPQLDEFFFAIDKPQVDAELRAAGILPPAEG